MKTTRNLKNTTSNLTGNKISTDILHCYDIVTKQNYSADGDKVITQTDGLTMGAPSSSIISTIFLQQDEYSHLPSLKQKQCTKSLPLRRRPLDL
jgi:hypothetical protein